MNNKISLKNEILRLLDASFVSSAEKARVRALLPFMSEGNVERIYKVLLTESKKNQLLDEKKRRIELRYKVMVDKFVKKNSFEG